MRRFTLQRHASGCRPKPFVCTVCDSSFGRKQDLDRHKRTVQCGGPPQPFGPAPKRRRIVASLNEDPVLAPPVEHAANDELSSAIRDFVHENWASVRTHVVNGPLQTRYNHRLTSLDTRDLHDQQFLLFEEQTTAFKVNVSFGFILKQKATSRLRYRIVDHPICCVGVTLPDYVKNNKAIVGLAKDEHGAIYNDNMCLFRCIALHLGREAAALYAEYTDTSVHDFAGVTLDDLHTVESKFETNVVVYQLVEIDNGKTMAELVRRSPAQYQETMYVNLHESHYSYIQDIGKYCHSYRCRKCGDSLWKRPWELHRHESTCEAGVNRIYKGGVYRPPSSVFERLDDEGVVVSDSLRFYPYRETFDFECFFTGDNVPADSDKVHWIARHVPLSVSLASNVPGLEPAQCYVTDGDSDKLVADMMSHLHAVSDAAFESLKPSYESVLDKLKMLKEEWDSAEEECGLEEAENEDEVAGKNRTNPFKKLLDQLFSWLHQLPVIGFNSGKYDLKMIKRSFVPLLISNNAAVIKRQNTYMCLYTDKLKFVDICNYLAPGVSYAKYLTAYGCE